ncbi:plant basic secretory protein [Stagonosporopsis vannaccii]|nr:plant basic secretory protein [Stagonosporopsis vannaccii]
MTSSSTPKMFQTMSPAPTSSSASAPQASALPSATSNEHSTTQHDGTKTPDVSCKPKIKPLRKPLLRLELRDLSSDGSREFLRLVHASSALESAVDTVLRLLYADTEKSCIPPTRSITLVLRDMDGVAYTTGLDLDDDHKEIHLSTKYIEYIGESRRKEEINGVLVHEMVHCWQHHGGNTAPGGLTEGVADWVRLKAGYAPPHWKRRGDCDWDAGYERTAYFLEWLEKKHGRDVVRRINQALRNCKYDADKLWHDCCGQSIEKLWEDYKRSLECDNNKGTETESAGQIQGPQEDENQPQEHEPTEDASNSPQIDHRTPREKARRGGNMMVPVRPGVS